MNVRDVETAKMSYAPELSEKANINDSKARLKDLDAARAVALITVVGCHVINRGDFPPGTDLYQHIYAWTVIYFNIPSFFFYTGIIMALRRPVSTKTEYFDSLGKTLRRLGIPFLFFSTVIFLGKFLTQIRLGQTVMLNNLGDYSAIFLTPIISPFSSFLWFIYVYIMYVLTLPVLILLLKKAPIPVIIASIIIAALPMTDWFALRSYFQNLPYFLTGYALTFIYSRYLELLNRWWPLALAVFAAALLFSELVHLLPAALIALPLIFATHRLFRLSFVTNHSPLQYIAKHMFPIYLMNTIFLNVSRGVLLHFLTWSVPNFYWMLPLLTIVGLSGPIMVKKYIVGRLPWLRHVTG